MAPRKRGVPPSTDRHPNKRTRQNKKDIVWHAALQNEVSESNDSDDEYEDEEDDDEDDDITARNSRESPLLRLPAEIRQRIWSFAFGGRILHICPDGYGLRLTHATYSKPPSDLKNHLVTAPDKEGAFFLVVSPTYRGMYNDTFEITYKSLNTRLKSTLVPLVSKQLYHEAVPCLWRLNTFCVLSAFALDYAFQMPQARLGLVEHLSVGIRNHHLWTWPKLLAGDLLAKMKSLKRVTIIVECKRDDDYLMLDRMDFVARKFLEVGLRWDQIDTVTIFKDHIPIRFEGSEFPEECAEYAEYTRNLLPQHVPPRGRRSHPSWEPTRRSARILALEQKMPPRDRQQLRDQRSQTQRNQNFLKFVRARKYAMSKSFYLRSFL